ncbi:MAG: cytochrome c oxidase subunit 3 [Caldilineaceae bacterium]
MTIRTERQRVTLPPAFNLSGSHTVGWWGMVMLILTEATVFAALISSYFYLRFTSPTWPTGSIERPDLLLVSINTVILLSSSWPMQMAVRSIRRNYQGGLQIGLAIAWVLAVLFLFFEGVDFVRSNFTPQTNVYGSLYFTILSLHGLHLIAGIGLATILLIRAWRGHFNERRYQAVENTALYWHFVDAVWIVIYASLYLSVYLTS